MYMCMSCVCITCTTATTTYCIYLVLKIDFMKGGGGTCILNIDTIFDILYRC